MEADKEREDALAKLAEEGAAEDESDARRNCGINYSM